MRDLLLQRIRPIVDRLAADLVDVAITRIEAELAHVDESLDVALSAFASEVPHAHSDRRDHDPVPHVRRTARRGLQRDKPRRQEDADSVGKNDAHPSASPAKDRRREEGQRAPRLVAPPARERTALQANGKQPPRCKNCGFIGGNSRGCGTSHETQTVPRMAMAPSKPATAAAKALARMRAPVATAEPDSDEGPEHWSAKRIDEETEYAEERKLGGELPIPRSSWAF